MKVSIAKIIAVVAALLLFSFIGVAAIEQLRVSNVQPSPVQLDQDIHTEVILFENQTQDFDVSLYLTHPDNTTTREGNDNGKIQAGDTRFFVFDINQSNVEQYGQYTFTVNDSVSGVEDTYNFVIARSDINVMSSQLSVTLALLFLAALFAFMGFKLDPANRIVAVLRAFLIMLAPLFGVAAVMTTGVFARNQELGVGTITDAVFIGSFFAWFVIVIVIGFLVYMTDAFKAATTEETEYRAEA